MTSSLKTSIEETNSFISCRIQSAAIPTIVAIANLILNNSAADNTWFLVPNAVLGHAYGCSLMYTVTTREELRMRAYMTNSFRVGDSPRRRASTEFQITYPFK
ncbi:hypothetical protein M422DRAFT_261314 [Sphaerobolus stellatus SS14]|uniref:Uncharacterized protein n=1 Tax=Sphaerobolus stellatus (strain SS14) TaxID=990650 RepID=A0A0C9VFI6_SPHS4|nr:hypothetical protein M422DRAFT_261314 [Sphaerobolus stellatus SS14]